MTLLPVNHCFHRIRILIISDGLVTGAVIPIGETVVNFVNISSFSVHDALVTQGSVTLFLAHNILAPIPVFPGRHDAVGHLTGRLTERLGGGCRLIALGHGKVLKFRRIIKTA